MEYISQLGLVALGSRMRAISDRLYATADEVYRLTGLEIQGRWLPLLRILHDRGPLTVGEVAEAVGQTHSAVSQLADKLVEQGWLQVVADPADKRRRRLSLTERAGTQLRAAKPLWRAIEHLFAQHCREQDIDLLRTLAAFERVLTPELASGILAQAAANDRSALRIVPFSPNLRAHFYRLNEAWLRKYFYVEEIDHRVLSNPENEILAPGGTILFATLGEDVVGTCALMPEAEGVYELTKGWASAVRCWKRRSKNSCAAKGARCSSKPIANSRRHCVCTKAWGFSTSLRSKPIRTMRAPTCTWCGPGLKPSGVERWTAD
jgi:DNA-binding MarR family transcriptional regulator